MAVEPEELLSEVYESVAYGGESAQSPLNAEAVARYLPDKLAEIRRLEGDGHTTIVGLSTSGGNLEVAPDNIAGVEPTEEPGNFLVRLKEGVVDRKGKILVAVPVVGAAILGAAFIYRHKKNG